MAAKHLFVLLQLALVAGFVSAQCEDINDLSGCTIEDACGASFDVVNASASTGALICLNETLAAPCGYKFAAESGSDVATTTLACLMIHMTAALAEAMAAMEAAMDEAMEGISTACGASFNISAMDTQMETQMPLMCGADGSFNTCGDAVAAMMGEMGAANETAEMESYCGIIGVCGVSMLIDNPVPLDFCDGDEVNACGEAVMASGLDDELSDAFCFILQCNATQPNFMDVMDSDEPPACFYNDTDVDPEDAASCDALVTTFLADCDACTTGAILLGANVSGCDMETAQTYITTNLESPYEPEDGETVEGAGSVALPAASLLMIAVAGQYVF